MSGPAGNDPRDPQIRLSEAGFPEERAEPKQASDAEDSFASNHAATSHIDSGHSVSEPGPDSTAGSDGAHPYGESRAAWQNGQADSEPPIFQSFSLPEVRPPERIPNFGHLALLGLLAGLGLVCAGLLTRVALAHRLFGISTLQKAVQDIHYDLGSEAALYLFTLIACLIVFPMVWNKSFFAGVQWNFATALRLRWRLLSAAFACFLLALLNGLLVPGPSNTPIDQIFKAPGAAWILFGFGVTFAPFFEETFFRGFLLPALCTAYDWSSEKAHHMPAPPLGENGHPQWSRPAMVAASVATSIPFALLHAEQTGWAIGPFCLLFGVSLVLCAVRLSTRSLASSVLVHASYNFMLFAIMMFGTGGFRHLDRM